MSRNLRDGVNVLADWAEKGMKIVVVTQALELNGVIGQTIAALLPGLAEIEHGNIRERQKAGIEAAQTSLSGYLLLLASCCKWAGNKF